jgi:PA14 domain
MSRVHLVVLLGLACSQRNPAYVNEARDAAPAELDSAASEPDVAAPPDAQIAPADVAAADVAADRAPDVAADRAPDADPVAGAGLRGSYYNGNNFETFVFSRVDPIVDFPWANDPPDPRLSFDGFSVRWTGTFRARYTETYTFTVHSGDGSRLSVNGTLIVDDWRTHAPEDYSGTIQLTAGRTYDIKLEYFHVTGWSVARLIWESPTQGKQVVPAGTFTPTP